MRLFENGILDECYFPLIESSFEKAILNILNRLNDSECEDEKTETSANEDSIPNGSLAHIHSYLSTIIEGNSPYGTEYGGSRKSTYYPPTASSIFNQLSPGGHPTTILETNKSPSATSRYSNLQSNPGDYYPLGSETSNRPTTPRFTIEEVSSANYEPILVTSPPGRLTNV